MFYKNWPHWLRLGLVFGIFGLSVNIIWFLLDGLHTGGWETLSYEIGFVYLFMPAIKLSKILNIDLNLFHPNIYFFFIQFFSYFIIGTIVGFTEFIIDLLFKK